MAKSEVRSGPPDAWPALRILGWAVAVAAVLSTEFLAQPFVWRWWSVGDVLGAWELVLADRLIVAATMAAFIIAATRVRGLGSAIGSGLILGAILAGSLAGEAIKLAVDPVSERGDVAAVAGRVATWSAVGAAMAGALAAWRRGARLEAESQDARLRAAQIRQMTTAKRLEALQRQLEPHFLFNTLATVKHLGRTAPERGRRLLSRLLDFIAATLAAGHQAETTLGQELDLVAAYLDVCQARMGERLEVAWSVEPSLRHRPFPSLMLGTLVENAMKHGLGPLPQGGRVAITARSVDAGFEVAVQDNGAGLRGDGGTGIGLANLTARLRLLHGSRSRFALEPVAAGGVRATLRLPAVGP